MSFIELNFNWTLLKSFQQKLISRTGKMKRLTDIKCTQEEKNDLTFLRPESIDFFVLKFPFKAAMLLVTCMHKHWLQNLALPFKFWFQNKPLRNILDRNWIYGIKNLTSFCGNETFQKSVIRFQGQPCWNSLMSHLGWRRVMTCAMVKIGGWEVRLQWVWRNASFP